MSTIVGDPSISEMEEQENVRAAKSNPVNDSAPQAVRFASKNEEIEPAHSLQAPSVTAEQTESIPHIETQKDDKASKDLSTCLHNAHLHQRRMSNFAFEPCSLPTSRVPSNSSTPDQSSREVTRSNGPSPRTSPPPSAMTTPPLTPHGTPRLTASGEGDSQLNKPTPKVPQGPIIPGETSSTSMSTSQPSTREPASTRPTTLSEESSSEDSRQKRATGFMVGPSDSASSQSRSREQSPAGRLQDEHQGVVPPISGLPRPRTPMGDKDDPYARSKRPPPPRNLEAIDARFKFGSADVRRRSGINLGSVDDSTNSTHSNPTKDLKNEHRKSAFSFRGGKDHHSGDEKHDKHDKPHGSMSDLKRFFGIGLHHHKAKRGASPAPSIRGSVDKSGTKTPPRHGSSVAVPFAEDHGLEKKYGKFSKLLGSGAGGSVRLLTRASDNRTFAVKQFRPRHNYESVKEYNKKVTAEFCIGSTLHHENIIETLDIIQEGGRWFEVMEYAPFDLFAIVMTGKMTREEVTCCFLQIVHGVSFLHSSGLAHRDLKLDNVVVNDLGILKIIDFGSASVFKYPFENDIILASGVVGSDPYLAPEVYDIKKYDPRPADIWSLAIIYACMTLRRFPWKAPRLTDNSFKLFVSEPNTEFNPLPEDKSRSRSTIDPSHPTPDDRRSSEPPPDHGHHHHHHHRREAESSTTELSAEAPKGEVMKGPWRLLRLLPRETRPIIEEMLKVDPKIRATLPEVLEDPWIKNAHVCHQLEHGKVQRAGSHNHVLEPGTPPTPSTSKA